MSPIFGFFFPTIFGGFLQFFLNGLRFKKIKKIMYDNKITISYN